MSTKFRLDPASDAWDRQPGEPAEEFDWWQHYRNEGHRRTHQRTAEKFDVKVSAINRVARQNQWASRIAALRRFEKQQVADRVDNLVDQALAPYTQAVAKFAAHAATQDLSNLPADRALSQVTAAMRALMPDEERHALHRPPDLATSGDGAQVDIGHLVLNALVDYPEARQAVLDAFRNAKGSGGDVDDR